MFKNKIVLITDGSGFIGKVLIERKMIFRIGNKFKT